MAILYKHLATLALEELPADDKIFADVTDPELMSSKRLKEIFGNRVGEIKTVLFQHAARIASPSSFLSKSDFFMWRRTETAPWRKYRKGQVHPSVYVSVLDSMLQSCNVPLSSNEILVDLTGGTPEVIVAGIVLGFGKVAVVAESPEDIMYMTPTNEEERLHQISYQDYTAPPDGAATLGPRCFFT